MTHSLITILLSAALSVLSPWKEGTLDIHLVSTGNGENTFVVMPDGTTMLIDAGAMKAPCIVEGKTPGAVLSDYIRHFSPKGKRLDYVFATHFHIDHTGSLDEIRDRFDIGRFIDRSGADAGTEKFVVGSRTQFGPVSGRTPGFEVFNVAGGGVISTGHGLLTHPLSTDDPSLYDENMMSCAILMRYGPFSYYTGADLPGSNWYVKRFEGGEAVTPVIKANAKVGFREFESEVASLVAPVTAMKIHHHGCPDGTTAAFLSAMRPRVLCCFGSEHKQPSPTTLRRIADPQLPCAHRLYVTTDRARESNGDALWDSVVNPWGHIVIRVTDGGRKYRVYVLDPTDRKYRIKDDSGECSTQDETPTMESRLPVADNFGEFDARFDSVFTSVSQVSGTDEIHSLMVLKDGRKIYERYDSGHTPDERHVFWSASKTFTSVAVGLAVQDSLFSVDDKVVSFFRDDELPSERSAWLDSMTVRDLLIMSSGLGTDGVREVRSLLWKHPAKEVLCAPMAFEPGSRYSYNSMNTYLLSEIVQRTTGLKTSEYLNGRLFRPLGICNWEWEESADGVTVGGWGLYSTTETLAKMGQFLLQRGEWEGRQILDPAWVDSLSTPHIWQFDRASSTPEQIAAYATDDWKTGYGYQVWICTHGAYRIDGAHGQLCIIIPDKNAVIAVTAQLHKGKKDLVRQIWKTIYPALQ